MHRARAAPFAAVAVRHDRTAIGKAGARRRHGHALAHRPRGRRRTCRADRRARRREPRQAHRRAGRRPGLSHVGRPRPLPGRGPPSRRVGHGAVVARCRGGESDAGRGDAGLASCWVAAPIFCPEAARDALTCPRSGSPTRACSSATPTRPTWAGSARRSRSRTSASAGERAGYRRRGAGQDHRRARRRHHGTGRLHVVERHHWRTTWRRRPRVRTPDPGVGAATPGLELRDGLTVPAGAAGAGPPLPDVSRLSSPTFQRPEHEWFVTVGAGSRPRSIADALLRQAERAGFCCLPASARCTTATCELYSSGAAPGTRGRFRGRSLSLRLVADGDHRTWGELRVIDWGGDTAVGYVPDVNDAIEQAAPGPPAGVAPALAACRRPASSWASGRTARTSPRRTTCA